MQISKISYKSANFPDRLREIHPAPKQLYTLGQANLNAPAIAIVGTRKPTSYGEEMTNQLAGDLARAGLTIVSGLAYGVDGIAHRAALGAGGTTIAVMAGGLDKIYPASHRQLAIDILAGGGSLISEYEEGIDSFRYNFVQRNRLVSGLSLAVLITEADAKSGSLITATYALDQNRLVFALPGNVTSARSAGPNNLIRAGAIPVTDATDIINALGFESGLVPGSATTADSPQEATIMELLQNGHLASHELIEATGFSAPEFAHVISLMEITGKVRNLGAGQWSLRI